LIPNTPVYTNAYARPADVVRLAADGMTLSKLGSVQRVEGLIVLLPDGRIAFTGSPSGRARLMAVAPGKDAAALINTTEETSDPATLVGSREIAFTIGPAPRQTIAIPEIANGRIVRQLKPGRGAVGSLAASPDGKTLYFGAGGQIWSMPSAGGEAKAVRPGESVVVEPSGRALLVDLFESSKARLFRVPLDGGNEREIVLDSALPLGHSRSRLAQSTRRAAC
jgi:hypothetical protein